MFKSNPKPNQHTLSGQENLINNSTPVCGRYLRYPNTTGKRIVEGGLRLQGKYKKSLPQKPLVTVITTVFNCVKYIEQAMLSVLEQTYDNIEYIVVDAASKDGTLDVINKYKDSLDYYISEPDSGMYSGMNKGVSLATGDYVIILNADDYYKEDAIEKLVQRAVEFKTDLVAAHSCNIDAQGNRVVGGLCRSTWTDFANLICPLKHETMLAKSDVYNKIGYYNEEMKICADSFWMAQAYNSQCSVSIVNEELLFFRNIGTSSSRELQERHAQERLSGYAILFESISDEDLEKLKFIGSLTPEIKTELIKNNPKCTRLHKALDVTYIWGYASGKEDSPSVCGRYLRYPDTTGKRIVEGGMRLKGKYKRSLPDKPLVTVVTTVFNCVKHIEQAMLSVLEQTYDNIEYIVVDAASKDGTIDIINKYKDSLDYYISEPDSGIYAGMNKGISLATGDYVIILNADDYYKEDAIEKLVREAIQSGADIVAAHAVFLDEKEEIIHVIKSRWTAAVYISSPSRHETMLVSKNCYNDIGYYDESRQLISDRIWMRAAYEQNKTVAILEENILMFRKIGVSSIQNTLHEQECNDALREIVPSITKTDMKKLRMVWKLTSTEIEKLMSTYSYSTQFRQALAVTLRISLTGKAEPAISVQVPVYNAERYLSECLDSILQQTFTDFEVICVDDGSTDASVTILKEYAQKDSRVLVFEHETNKGTLQARRTAFEKAEGKYMVFVDADDIAKPNMFEELYTKAVETDSDLVQCGATIYDPEKKLTNEVYDRYQNYFSKVHNYSAQGKDVFCALSKKIKNNFWVSISRKNVYKTIIPYIPDAAILHGNDNLVMFMLVYFSQKYASLDRILYMYRANEGSSNLNTPSIEKVKSHIQSRSEALFYAKEFMKKVERNWNEKMDPFPAFSGNLFKYNVILMERCLLKHPNARMELLQFLKDHFGEQVVLNYAKKNSKETLNTTDKKVVAEAVKKELKFCGSDVSVTTTPLKPLASASSVQAICSSIKTGINIKLHDTWQDVINMTMDGLLVGTGWHEVEKQDNVYLRWTGPESIATIHLNPRRDRENRMNFTIHAAASEDILTGLRLEADGNPLHATLGKKRDPAFLTAVLPADRSKKENEKTVFTLYPPRTLPSSQAGQEHTDNRLLGIALRRIDIFPLARSLFTAQKYNDPELFDGLHYIRHNPGVRDAVIHGAYASAYEYFLKHDRTGSAEAFELHELFDECPGDLFDILRDDMQEQARKLEEKYQEEITLLRDIVYRQGDAIRALKGQGNRQK